PGSPRAAAPRSAWSRRCNRRGHGSRGSRSYRVSSDKVVQLVADIALPASCIKSIDFMVGIRVMDIRAFDLNLLKAFNALMSERALVGRLARSFAAQAHSATLRVTPASGHEALERLEHGEIDVAVAYLPHVPPHIDSTVLLRDRFVLVARRGHPIGNQELPIE